MTALQSLFRHARSKPGSFFVLIAAILVFLDVFGRFDAAKNLLSLYYGPTWTSETIVTSVTFKILILLVIIWTLWGIGRKVEQEAASRIELAAGERERLNEAILRVEGLIAQGSANLHEIAEQIKTEAKRSNENQYVALRDESRVIIKSSTDAMILPLKIIRLTASERELTVIEQQIDILHARVAQFENEAAPWFGDVKFFHNNSHHFILSPQRVFESFDMFPFLTIKPPQLGGSWVVPQPTFLMKDDVGKNVLGLVDPTDPANRVASAAIKQNVLTARQGVMQLEGLLKDGLAKLQRQRNELDSELIPYTG